MFVLALLLFFGHKKAAPGPTADDKAYYVDIRNEVFEVAVERPALIDPYIIQIITDLNKLQVESRTTPQGTQDFQKLQFDIRCLNLAEHVLDIEQVV